MNPIPIATAPAPTNPYVNHTLWGFDPNGPSKINYFNCILEIIDRRDTLRQPNLAPVVATQAPRSLPHAAVNHQAPSPTLPISLGFTPASSDNDESTPSP